MILCTPMHTYWIHICRVVSGCLSAHWRRQDRHRRGGRHLSAGARAASHLHHAPEGGHLLPSVIVQHGPPGCATCHKHEALCAAPGEQ